MVWNVGEESHSWEALRKLCSVFLRWYFLLVLLQTLAFIVRVVSLSFEKMKSSLQGAFPVP